MDFFSKLAPIIFSSNPVAVPDYLVERKLLPDSCECIYCNKPMILGKRPTKDTTDGYGWQFIYGRYLKRLTRTIKSWHILWEISTTTCQTTLSYVLWSQDTMVKNAAETTGISQKTVVQMYQYFREVCSTKLINSPAQLDGTGIVVQIDKNLFNHKSKYQRGCRPSTKDAFNNLCKCIAEQYPVV